MTELNERIRNIPMPDLMCSLPIEERGYPVPWFVAWINGKPDFRVVDTPKIQVAHRKSLCWLCGQPHFRFKCFTIGPMCAINRISSELPAHVECARYAVRTCPFLSNPRMRRNDKDLPDHQDPGGVAIMRNPKVTLLWVCLDYKPINDGRGGVLFRVGKPVRTEWYREGRLATRAEIMESIEEGLPLLQGIAEDDGPEAVSELDQMYRNALELLPA